MKIELKTRVYKLTRNKRPLSFIIPSRNTRKQPLLYFDEEKGYNRELRYASNQKSCFVDEQDGNVIIRPIIFEDGMLTVPKTNPTLQMFLHYHPLNGRKFEEVVVEKDAAADVEKINVEIDAMVAVKDMTVEQMETIARVLFRNDVSKMSSSELKRDMLLFAKNNPSVFLDAINDPEVKLASTVQLLFDKKLLAFRNKKKDIHFNLAGNKKRLTAVPFGEDPIEYLVRWFKSDDGVEVLEFLEGQI